LNSFLLLSGRDRLDEAKGIETGALRGVRGLVGRWGVENVEADLVLGDVNRVVDADAPHVPRQLLRCQYVSWPCVTVMKTRPIRGAARSPAYFGAMNRLNVTSLSPDCCTLDVLCRESGSTDEDFVSIRLSSYVAETMTRLGIADYEAVLSFLEEAQTLDGLAPITPELLDRLAQLAHCEWAAFFEVDDSRRIFTGYIPCAAEGGTLSELEDEQLTSKRTVEFRRHKSSNLLGPVLLSDAFSLGARTDRGFNINFREYGFTDQIHVNLDPTRDWAAEIVVYRSGDLGERERLILRLLRPHLAAMYRGAEVRRRLARTSAEFDPDALAALTPRECEVMRCVADGLTNQDIAAALVVELCTVRKHLEHVYEKLRVHSRTAAVALLRQPRR
jgi:DNA-binding CsgD family transcriptional regulator